MTWSATTSSYLWRPILHGNQPTRPVLIMMTVPRHTDMQFLIHASSSSPRRHPRIFKRKRQKEFKGIHYMMTESGSNPLQPCAATIPLPAITTTKARPSPTKIYKVQLADDAPRIAIKRSRMQSARISCRHVSTSRRHIRGFMQSRFR